jgi:hypothetical protein
MPEYLWTLRFQAADDEQAERLAHAWSGTVEAEFGATFEQLSRADSDGPQQADGQ